MTHPLSFRSGLVLGLLTLGPVAGPLDAQVADTVRGTISSMDARTGRFGVITGVGMALRVVQLQAGTAIYATADGTPVALTDIKPGDIVRVEYRATPQGNVCDKVERIGRMGTGGAP